MRLIDADIAQSIADKELFVDEAGVVQFVLSHAPTIDAEPVVRCKDCKRNPEFETKRKHMVWCRQWRSEVRDTGFCSYGERRADNG